MKFLLMFFLALPVFASLENAPPSFSYQKFNVVFIDIEKIEAHIHYDLDQKKAFTTSEIEFEQISEGAPIFDLVPEIAKASINGKPVQVELIESPQNETSYRLVKKKLPPGKHKLIIEHILETNTNFKDNTVEAAFWMSDLTDRRYLERYLPCNLEFDQYSLDLEITFNRPNIGRHDIFTNGMVKEISANHYKIRFPDYFTSSSFYFHITTKDKFKVKKTHFMSVDGRRIPLTIYSDSNYLVRTAEKLTREVIVELEEKLGPWGHPTLTIYVAGAGGMEYSGATRTSNWALGHELIHSYFARGVMPVRGNSGWIDEAIASWRDDGYKERRTPGFRSTSMGNHSIYRRFTDRKAYDKGADFMEYLNHRLQKQGGLISFLKDIYKNHMHQTITTKDLQTMLKNYSGEDFGNDFKKYILGNKNNTHKSHTHEHNPYHIPLTEQQELELL